MAVSSRLLSSHFSAALKPEDAGTTPRFPAIKGKSLNPLFSPLYLNHGERLWGHRSSPLRGCTSLKRVVRVCAMQADDLPPEMTHESALEILGVRDGASFDEILRAKNNMIAKCDGDQERLMMVETAYDILLMQSLNKRRSGKGVDINVKYADVRKPKPASSNPSWLDKVTKGAPVSIEQPSSKALAVQAAVFGALAAWTLFGGISSGEEIANPGSDVPGAQLALAFAASIYFLRQDNVKLGKATLVTTGGLILGAIVGSLVESWLRVDIFPVFGIGSPAVVVSEFAFLALWLSSSFVR